jgi:hypothetical protein
VALLAKGWKAAAAVAIVAVLSAVVLVGNFTSHGRLDFSKVYGIGAVAGLLVSLTTTILIRRQAPRLRAKNLILTVGAVVGGAALVSVQPVAEMLVGEKASDTGMLILNYALGYFMVGVTFDAIRVYRTAKRKKSAK